MKALDFKTDERLDLLSITTIGQSQMRGLFTFDYCGSHMSDWTLIFRRTVPIPCLQFFQVIQVHAITMFIIPKHDVELESIAYLQSYLCFPQSIFKVKEIKRYTVVQE